MVRLKNTLDAVHLYRPAGAPGSLLVELDQVVEVRGELVDDSGDRYLIEDSGEQRAWPKARWQLVKDKPAKTAAQPAPAEEE